jgi:hypothetical protein
VAWTNVGVHLLALILSATVLAPGSPLMGLDERVGYLAAYPLGWSLGWGTWMLCDLALIAFFAVLARRLHEQADWGRLAVILAAAGAGVDLLCNVLYITTLPMLAAQSPPDLTSFRLVERTANAGGLVVANGLYSIGTLVLNLCLLGRQRWTSCTLLTGYGVFLFGMVLVVAGFIDSALLAAVATGPTIGLFCLWTVMVLRMFNRGESQA